MRTITQIDKIRDNLDELGVSYGSLPGDDTQYVNTSALYKALGLEDVVIIESNHYIPIQYTGLIIGLANYADFLKLQLDEKS